MMSEHKIKPVVLVILALVTILSGCINKSAINASILPEKILALAKPPDLSVSGSTIHAQWVFEELEGLPPNQYKPQFVRRTKDVWIDTSSPWRYRIRTVTDPVGLSFDNGWNGHNIWLFNIESNPSQVLYRELSVSEAPSESLDLDNLFQDYSELLEQALKNPDQLKYIGRDNMEPWGGIHIVAYEWDGATARTSLYKGYPHTVLFKITESNHWLIEWLDIIQANNEEIVHRRYQVIALEEFETQQLDPMVWVFSPPQGLTVVEALPEPTAISSQSWEQFPTRALAGTSVPDFGFTPYLPNFLPDGLKLILIEPMPFRDSGGYHLVYGLDDHPIMDIFQAVDLKYGWGNEPEIMELSWARVEIAAIDPIGPSGWIAAVEPHLIDGQLLPNIHLMLKLPEKELMLQVLKSLSAVDE